MTDMMVAMKSKRSENNGADRIALCADERDHNINCSESDDDKEDVF